MPTRPGLFVRTWLCPDRRWRAPFCRPRLWKAAIRSITGVSATSRGGWVANAVSIACASFKRRIARTGSPSKASSISEISPSCLKIRLAAARYTPLKRRPYSNSSTIANSRLWRVEKSTARCRCGRRSFSTEPAVNSRIDRGVSRAADATSGPFGPTTSPSRKRRMMSSPVKSYLASLGLAWDRPVFVKETTS